ncbi:lamin tail domain-containing protein, partial [Flavobacterium sp.]|uniref:beta strand repeat-containing protein n=1 Tax=Flavobacterium sp. TaxID=239 RepID=UPI0026028393
MIFNLFKKRCSLTVVVFLFTSVLFSQNLLTNGDFQSGGNGVGFNINGSGYSEIVAPFSGSTSPGNYAFTTNPFPMNTANFLSVGDHTTGTGNMMIIDGLSGGGVQNFWKAGNTGGGVCGLTIGTTYTFSYWIRSVSSTVTSIATQADISVQFNNVSSFSLVSGSSIAPLPANGWQQVVYNFVPSSSCVNIELFNNHFGFVGNDFAVDDFSVLAPPQPLSVTSSVVNSSCFQANNASIVVYGLEGVTPYVTYSISGPVNQTNSTGVFNNLLPGIYSVFVTDSNGVTANQMGVFVSEPNGLTTSSDVSICSGSSTTLTASGSSSGYSWTASPTDASLTTPTSSSPIVSPNQTTTYTVTSTNTTSTNLIFNGNFSQGNNGFTTDYQYLVTTIPVGSQGTYGIVPNSNAWFAGFSSCTDHTTGTGNMMVIDGSTLNSGNDKLWCQTVSVIPGQNYTFSYWVQTVATPNPANIEVTINGASIGIALAPSTTCGWVQRTYTWNSGASTTAQICMYDRVITSSGNDFAIDDISFSAPITCTLSEDIVVTVNPSLTTTVSCGVSTNNSVSFTWTAVSGAVSYGINYSINGGAVINPGVIGVTNYTVNSLNANDSVLINVIPIGASGTCFSSSSQTCLAISSCPTPTGSVTQQPTCAVPTGIIEVTSPLNVSPLPIPTDLFISEVTDEDVGALTYIEIYNGTGTPKNLANYKIKLYNNGNTFTSCEFPLVGTLNNNDVYVVSVGSVTNAGGVVPDLVVASCAGVNNNDNIRLTSSTDIEIDLWGRTDGIAYTPASLPGYTYRRLQTAPHPSMTWNAADWTALDPQDYTNVGFYTYATSLYEYSINGTTYQSSPIFSGLASGTYNVTVRDLVSGCISNPLSLVVNSLPVVAAPSVTTPVNYCQNTTASPLSATASTGGTLNWYGTNATGGIASSIPTVPSTATIGTVTYYVSQTIGGCEGPRAAIVVNVLAAGPSLNLFCDGSLSTPTSLYFDFSNVGQTNFTYSYSVAGGPIITGTWVSPSHYIVSGLTPGQSVTFTITANGTATCVTPMTVTCNTACATTVTPNFAAISPICSGGTVPTLATTSPNGIVGTWSPSIISNTASGNYVFTPNSTLNPCANTQTLSVVVNSPITPTFTAIAPICSGATLAALPLTSNNGITGTWSPALNNTTTTIYTFTPNAGQCATTTSLTITVNSNVTPTFNAVAPICSGATLSPLPTTSNNGILGSWSPALNNTTTTTYTFTPNSGQCATTTTLTITVNGATIVPTFTAVSAICSGAVLSALPTTSNNGIIGTWSPSLNNTTTTIYTFTPNAGQCALTTTLQINVNPNIVPTFTTSPSYCSGSTIPSLPTISNNGITGTWSPSINNLSTTTYTFTPSTGQCATTTTHVITINPRVTPTFSTVSDVCFGATMPPLPTTSNNGISGSWSPALNNAITTTYTFTPLATFCANTTTLQIVVIPQTTPTLSIVSSCNANTVTVTNPVGSDYQYSVDGLPYQSSPIFSGLSVGNHDIVANQISSNCFTNPANFNISSSSNDVITNNPLPLEYCDPNNDGFGEFDLTQVISTVTGGNPYTVTFHETATDANIDGTPIPNPSNYSSINPNTQIIYIRVESNSTTCYSVVPLQLIVNPTPEATVPQDYHECDNDYDGFTVFDLSSVSSEV